jgi:hypothetical protein
MASLSDFLPHVLPHVPGCAVPLALQQIRHVCIDFCTKAPIVQVELDPIDVLAGQAQYDIDTPPGTDVSLILTATWRGLPLPVLTGGKAGQILANRPTGQPSGLVQAADNTFTLNSTPTEAQRGAIGLLVSTRPTRTAMSVADVLLNDYAHEIGLGVVARLVVLPGQPFSAPGNAAYYKGEYERARTEARIEAERSFGAASHQVRPRAFQ